MSEKIKVIQSSGKRKAAIARAVLKYPAKGQIKINKIPLDLYEPEVYRERIKEIFIVANNEKLSKCDIKINVRGGGKHGQTEVLE